MRPSLTPAQESALRALVDAVLGRELAAQDCEASPALPARLRLRVCLFLEGRAIARAVRLGLRRERCYGVGDWLVWLTPEGTATLSGDRDVDTLNRQVTLEEANRVLEVYGLCLRPTAEDFRTALLLNLHGRYLASATIGDEGDVDLRRPNSWAVALTRSPRWQECVGELLLDSLPLTVAAAQRGEFRPPLPESRG